MTAAETTWIEADQPFDLLQLLENDVLLGRIDRKWRLYLLACARQFSLQLSHEDRDALVAAEELADGTYPSQGISWKSFGCWLDQNNELFLKQPREPIVDQRRMKATLLKDIFGNPFRTIHFGSPWRSPGVVDLARSMYEERQFDRMPILADALVNAGCDSEDILSHCHHKGPHVRGCWVVDLILQRH